jgi:hypothetical protein
LKLTFAVVSVVLSIVIAGCTRRSAPPPTRDLADAASHDVPSCAKVLKVGITVRGTYGFDSEASSTAPRLGFTPDVGPGPVFFTFPELPAVTVAASDMCSGRIDDGDFAVTCVDGPGSVRSVVASRLDVARGFQLDPECVQLEDHVGVHDVQAVAKAWMEATKGCGVDGGVRRRVPFLLDVSPPTPPKERYGNHHVRARLRAPSLGVNVALGDIDHEGSCYARRFDNPRGVAYACSDEDIELVAVYQVGRTVFYRTWSPRLSTLTLPCDVDADFDVKSAERLPWE